MTFYGGFGHNFLHHMRVIFFYADHADVISWWGWIDSLQLTISNYANITPLLPSQINFEHYYEVAVNFLKICMI